MWRLALTILSVLLLLTVVEVQTSHSSHPAQSHEPSSNFSELITDAMIKMHEDMTTPQQTGDADRDFLAMMIPHHQGAVDMARLVLIYGRDPLVRQLATEIIAGQ